MVSALEAVATLVDLQAAASEEVPMEAEDPASAVALEAVVQVRQLVPVPVEAALAVVMAALAVVMAAMEAVVSPVDHSLAADLDSEASTVVASSAAAAAAALVVAATEVAASTEEAAVATVVVKLELAPLHQHLPQPLQVATAVSLINLTSQSASQLQNK